MAEKTRVGFIGLGRMGSRMAANVLAAGYPLVVYNRTRERAEALAQRGATVAGSPKDAAGRSDVVITMLSDPDAIRSVLTGENGILAGAHEGLVYIDMSTVGPLEAREEVAIAGQHGVRVVNAPVLGSLGPAEKGELVIFTGGDQALVDQVRPILQTMGKTIRHMGSNEQACVTKLAANLMLAGSMQLFGEAVALTTRWGVPREQSMDVIGSSAVVSPAVKAHIGAMYTHDAPSEFDLKLARKDLYLTVEAGYEKGASLPLVAEAMETFSMALKHHGAHDVGAIAAFIDEASA
jgi:3-hydroxyisobutyrate dehydrogenase-like beta-hydroxyacid dehydrogenase